MAYNEVLTNRVREALADRPVVDEVKMFQGVCFMVDDKMCVCVNDQGLLCRIGREQALTELEKGDCRQMMNGGRVMKDFVYVDMENLQSAKNFDHWINLALQFNKVAKPSKKKKN
ncbi:TfoX/Sxy family protein [Mucilaginibacter sabulilitoris]|uniref:TfoX/Sxy family protein n=1 Tax=Mucilaginibacter sabulilitoris TaxID=1173583 RepID=A0ABZ0TQE7_9SPHI|nr:TfoX/Sxy family protein [Mucilaginibacter sabulilitoris]WPU95056.1 TfoX/Sxy family protein [Mucilaginibacter sabulilitoris]